MLIAGKRLFRNLILVFVCLLGAEYSACAARRTALDTYVHAPDSHYRYELVETTHLPHETVFHLRMVSQAWRNADEVTQPEWVHWLEIYVPDKVTGTTGLLFISGGSTRSRHPEPNPAFENIATETSSVVTELHDVPNEPLTFVGDAHGPRNEDAIIAYTWRRYIETGDSTWPLRLPMTKAAVRAMDTVTGFLASSAGGGHSVDHFVLAGASKRGWTVWTTAAVDPRVIAIVPMVIDVLHVVPSFEHHYRSYGFWSRAVKDYADEGLMDQLHSKQYRSLMKIEDPYSYRERFTMPKLLILASGDQFFLPDSSQFYFSRLPGEKHLLYEPNTDHSLRGSTVFEDLTAFYLSVLRKTQRPDLRWHLSHDGTLRVETTGTPTKVTLWQATNSEHRDFRLESIGRAYHATELKASGKGLYITHIAVPAKGWSAFYVEAEFPGDSRLPLHFTTAVKVLPDVEPYVLPRRGATRLEPEHPAATANGEGNRSR
ncbi:PhoPQ-activated pathogenicity-related family protein [Paracidobacterium acidisoli]|nr:PhoPQ-activated pathogenicity-related family protein [Paracidobacterium acidisoli]MBT9331522.1 PhoPQ-activated pathogenicity-related family protein [Paracidobacterium acidisoli]